MSNPDPTQFDPTVGAYIPTAEGPMQPGERIVGLGVGTARRPEPDPPTPKAARTFRAAVNPQATLPFDLEFTFVDDDGEPTVNDDGSPHVETHSFVALADAGAGGAFAVGGLVRYNDRGDSKVDIVAMRVFFRRVLIDESWGRMETLLDRKDTTVPMDMLGDVFNWLMETITGRPTKPPRRN